MCQFVRIKSILVEMTKQIFNEISRLIGDYLSVLVEITHLNIALLVEITHLNVPLLVEITHLNIPLLVEITNLNVSLLVDVTNHFFHSHFWWRRQTFFFFLMIGCEISRLIFLGEMSI